MCQGYADHSKVNRELRYYMKGRSFDKMDLEIKILSWMPFKVGDLARYNKSLLINPILILLAWQGVSDSMSGPAVSPSHCPWHCHSGPVGLTASE